MARALVGLLLLVHTTASLDDGDGAPAVDDVPASTASAEPAPTPEVVQAPLPAVDYSGAWPFGGSFAQRLWCIESHESGHDPSAVNSRSGAKGLLQWLRSTAQAWGVTVGNRASEWRAAVAIHAISETFFRSQWPVTARLCP